MATYKGRMHDELKYVDYDATFADIMPHKLTMRIPGYNYEAISKDGYVYRGSFNEGHPDLHRHVEFRLYTSTKGNVVRIGKHWYTGPQPWETAVVMELYSLPGT